MSTRRSLWSYHLRWDTDDDDVWVSDGSGELKLLEDAIRELETKPRTFYLPDGSEVVDVEVQP